MQSEDEQRTIHGFSRFDRGRWYHSHSLSLDFFAIHEIGLDCLSFLYPIIMIYVDIYVQKKSIEIPSSLDGKKRNEIDFLTMIDSSHEEKVYRTDIHSTLYSSHDRYFIAISFQVIWRHVTIRNIRSCIFFHHQFNQLKSIYWVYLIGTTIVSLALFVDDNYFGYALSLIDKILTRKKSIFSCFSVGKKFDLFERKNRRNNPFEWMKKTSIKRHNNTYLILIHFEKMFSFL